MGSNVTLHRYNHVVAQRRRVVVNKSAGCSIRLRQGYGVISTSPVFAYGFTMAYGVVEHG